MPNNLFSHDYGKIYKLHVTETVEDQKCVFNVCKRKCVVDNKFSVPNNHL